jgi:AraC-like DNA-binding protein/mannose-6-phosphate isomerase-like protein (cupin superfamily)
MKTQNEQSIRQMQVTRLPLGAYDFVIHYAEMLDEGTFEFRHSHSYTELFYVHSGELSIIVVDEYVTMRSGDLMIVPAGISHHVQNIPGEKKNYFVMIFEFKPGKNQFSQKSSDYMEIKEIEAYLNKLPPDHYVLCPSGWDAGVFIDQICLEHSKKQVGWAMFTNMLYYGFFLNALRYIVKAEPESKPVDDALNLAIEATKYIHAHYPENISLDTLADHLHISQRHANRIFRKMFNTTFGKTLRSLRLTYAKTLLATTGLPVEEVAERVGLGSSQALRKLFKQTEGVTISEYRAQKKQGE